MVTEAEQAAFDIDEVAGDVHAVFAPIASTKDVNFVLDLRDDARGVWRGDFTVNCWPRTQYLWRLYHQHNPARGWSNFLGLLCRRHLELVADG